MAEAIFWLCQNSPSDDVHGSTSSDGSTDSTYIKLPSGNGYLMAIIDWYSRKVLSWQAFNTMDTGQYVRLLRDTIEQYGCSAIFHTDQGVQCTSDAFTSVLIEYGIEISFFVLTKGRRIIFLRPRGVYIILASTRIFVLSRELLERLVLVQLHFYATFAPTLPYVSHRQRHGNVS